MHKRKIHISPAWRFQLDDGEELNTQLFSLLAAIHRHRNLRRAAESANISYRHAWNLLKKWSAFFNTDLARLKRGQGATLTPLGEKLVWAEQRINARLAPQLANLASELNLEINKALTNDSPILRIYASHGYAVATLPTFCEHIQLDLQYTTGVAALQALNQEKCDIAGFHIPSNPTMWHHHVDVFRKLLKSRIHKLIHFVRRQQGIILPTGNPEGIQSLQDLAMKNIRFINRETDSGTRALLDILLQQHNVNSALINGFSDEEYTHSAVAAYVASGMANAGFGIEAAARQFGLDFIPVATEDYLMIFHQKNLQNEQLSAFIDVLRSEHFHRSVNNLPGYQAIKCGIVDPVSTIFADKI